MKITIESPEGVSPSSYNPRQADPKRLDLIELSLRKLGFLTPIFVDADGEILSGHQRHLVATRMGATRLPIFRTKAMPLPQRKAMNIVFNRATNDFDFHSTPGKVTRELESIDVESLAASISDKPVDSPEFLRCVEPREVSVKDLCRINAGRWVQYARNVAATLYRAGILMPIIAKEDGIVLNGIGRLEPLSSSGGFCFGLSKASRSTGSNPASSVSKLSRFHESAILSSSFKSSEESSANRLSPTSTANSSFSSLKS